MNLTPRTDFRSRRRARRPFAIWMAAVVLALLALTGCSAMNDSASAPGEAAGADGGGGDVSDEGSNVPQAPGGVDSSTAFQPRKISRGEVTVEVDNLNKASQLVRDLAAGLGGYVSDESIGISQTSYPGSSNGTEDSGSSSDQEAPDVQFARPGEARLTLRLPPAATTDGMNEIAALGEEVSRWKSDTEVELTLVDLESRIATQTKSVQDITALMDRATTLTEIVTLEREVSTRTAELESLKSRQASIAEQVQMSTVTAVLRTSERVQAAEDETGFLNGLSSGWDALQASVSVLLTIVGALLPFAFVGVLVGYPIYRAVRGRRRPQPVPATVAAAEPTP